MKKTREKKKEKESNIIKYWFTEGRNERDKYWVKQIKGRIEELERETGITELKKLLKNQFTTHENSYEND